LNPTADASAAPAPAHAFRFVAGPEIARARELHQSRHFGQLVAEGLVDKLFPFSNLWRGTVTVPEDFSPEARFRLVVAEFEEYLVDDLEPYDPVPTEKGRRLVFVEHVELI
jgi:hypothetical protein